MASNTKRKRKARLRKLRKQLEKAKKNKLKKKILHFIRLNKITEAGLLMERYKERYGDLKNESNRIYAFHKHRP